MTNEFILEAIWLYSIDYSILLEADAIVIAGILILLTIYSLKLKPSENPSEKIINSVVAVAIVITIIPFSVSSILVLYQYQVSAVDMAYAGFVYLIVGIVFIIGIPRIGLCRTKVTRKP
jgi:hypothetical protein